LDVSSRALIVLGAAAARTMFFQWSLPMPGSEHDDGEPLTAMDTILLAEDDQAVRMLAKRTLERHGFQVFDAADGVAAIEQFESLGGAIDLLLTDVIMPRMGGKQLAKELKGRAPGLPVLYFSGFTDDTILRQEGSGVEVAFLPKPFTAQDLVGKVRSLIDSSKSS